VDLLRLPDVTIGSQLEAIWFGTPLTQVSFHRSLLGGIDCHYYFDAARGWLYHGNEKQNLKTGARSVSRVFYQPDGITPWKLEAKLFPPEKAAYLAYTAEVIEFRKEEHPDREFSLTQFDLPEPVTASPSARSFPLYLWFIVAAMAFGGLGLLCRIIAKRTK
jgi:hypothetical protein